MSNPRTRALSDAGVSIWLDDLSRERLTSGSLRTLIDEYDVVGVTTNPTIFASALADGADYAEQLGTLASLYPGRIDLGLGRAPGTDQTTARAIRGGRLGMEQDFGRDIQQLQTYFSAANRSSAVRAIPGEGLDIPIYVLGSSTDSAYLAAAMGLPYAFASHFAPGQLFSAINIYRRNFKPSPALAAPYVIACVNVIAADTDAEAQYLATTLQQMMLGVVTGQRRLMQPPVESMAPLWTPEVQQYVLQMLSASFIGSKATLQQELTDFIAQTQVNEVMAASHIFSHEARVHSYRLLADVTTLQTRIADLTTPPEKVVGGAAALIEEVAATKISGEEDRYSGTDLWDMQANLEGAHKIVELLRPLLLRADAALLNKVEANFRAVDAVLGKYRMPGGGFQNYEALKPADRNALQGPITELAEDLSRLRGTLGLS